MSSRQPGSTPSVRNAWSSRRRTTGTVAASRGRFNARRNAIDNENPPTSTRSTPRTTVPATTHKPSRVGEGGPHPSGKPDPVRRTVWMLALAAGYVDGLALLYLGGIFASVASGNLVVTGVTAAAEPTHLTGTATRAALAVTGYTATVALARRLPPARCLVAELLALCTLCGGWAAAHHDPHGLIQLPLLALATIAMGLQTAAHRDTDPPTTHLTGTLTRLARGKLHLVTDAPPLIAIPAGAAAAALLLDRAPWLGPLPAVALIAGACVAHAIPARQPQPSAAAEARQAAFTS